MQFFTRRSKSKQSLVTDVASMNDLSGLSHDFKRVLDRPTMQTRLLCIEDHTNMTIIV